MKRFNYVFTIKQEIDSALTHKYNHSNWKKYLGSQISPIITPFDQKKKKKFSRFANFDHPIQKTFSKALQKKKKRKKKKKKQNGKKLPNTTRQKNHLPRSRSRETDRSNRFQSNREILTRFPGGQSGGGGGNRAESNVSRTKPQADDRRGRPGTVFRNFSIYVASARPLALARDFLSAFNCGSPAGCPPDPRIMAATFQVSPYREYDAVTRFAGAI